MPSVTFRSWRSSDVDALIKHASNPTIWDNLKDRFPHPYTQEHAEDWIGFNQALIGGARHFAIDVNGQVVGSVGFDFKEDIFSQTAEVGYWVAESFWGQGIGTSAAQFISGYAFDAFPDLLRLQAFVFEWNPASARVLTKAGFTQEARMRKAVTKNDRVGDVLLYARIRGDK